jgi:hypothetical protein
VKDLRFNKPSASSMARIYKCPASHAMSIAARANFPEKDDAAANTGTRIHSALAGEIGSEDLNLREEQTHDMCLDQARVLYENWHQRDGWQVVELREVRLGLTADNKVALVNEDTDGDIIQCTGQLDRAFIQGNRALIIDYKTLSGVHAHAQDNPQLATLIAMMAIRYNLDDASVAIVQPWKGKPTTRRYDWDDLNTAVCWLKNTLIRERSSTTNDLKAGDWCKFCPASATCPKIRAAVHVEVNKIEPLTISHADGKAQRAAMFARLNEMPAEELANIVRGLTMIERFTDSVKGVAKHRAETDPEFQQFFQLKEKSGRRSVTNTELVFGRCLNHGVSQASFAAECKITLGSIGELLKGATGAKGRALEEMTKEVIEGAVESGKSSFELVPAPSPEPCPQPFPLN